MSLLKKMLSASSVEGTSVMSDSIFFNDKDMVPTELPVLNIAFSGSVSGGFTPGLTILAGESKTFKSALSLFCLKAYLDKYPESIGVLYDSEYGITPEYIKSFGIDPSQVIHTPIEHIEQWKFDFIKKLDNITRGEKVFFLVDSLGQLSSKKETDDALDEKSVADMTRAKAIRSVLRLATLQLVKKDLPCFIVNHVYSEQGLFPKTIIPGGSAVSYSSNTILVITKSQEKEGTELAGWSFNLNVHKSRTVKEKTRLSFRVMYEEGIKKYSGMLDIAVESGFVIKPSNGWYQIADPETGELIGNKTRAKDAESDEFLGKVIQNPKFQDWVKSKFKLGEIKMLEAAAAEADDLME